MGEPITKERLHKYIFIRREVENHLERLTRMKNQALIPARRDGDGSQHTPGASDRMADAIIKRLAYEDKTSAAINEKLDEMDRVKLFISGRPLKAVLDKLGHSKDKSARKYVSYLDGDNFTGDYRKGNWYFQHFHDKEGIKQLLESSGFKIERMTYMTYGDSWQVEAVKVRDLSRQEHIDGVDFEFNLPLPGGKSYQRNEDVKRILGLI